jgi:predicted TIM-barrel fold metal-dependent hydrolase
MLIDVNANIGHWPFRQTKGNTCKALLERMDQSGIDVSVVSNMNGIFYKDTQASNEELHEEIISDPLFRDRFIPFAIFNPIYAGWKGDLDKCISEMGIKGIRLYPKYHDYELTDPACIELVEMARDRGLAVSLTLRMADSRARSWMDIDWEWNLADVIPIFKKVPDAKYMVLNIANGIHLNDEDTAIFKNADVVFDTSGRNIYNLSELILKFGTDMFAFGTHSPILDYLTGLLRIESLRESEADQATMELLRSGNAKRILGL